MNSTIANFAFLVIEFLAAEMSCLSALHKSKVVAVILMLEVYMPSKAINLSRKYSTTVIIKYT